MTALKDHPRTEPEILIEEARRRTRERRRRGAALVAVAVLVAAGLYLVMTHGSGQTAAGTASASATRGSVAPPAADAIVFARATSDSLDARIEIAYVSATGGPVVALTDAWKHKMIASDPTWSPDGSQIAFVMSPRGHLTRYAGDGDIYVMNANGTHMRQLTHGLAASVPAWSPDGSQIAFIEGQGQALAIVDTNGSNQHVIAHGRGYYEAPAWSPNGRWIAYDSGPDWDTHAIYTIAANGTGERRLTPFLGPGDGGPAWSPKGSRIAYSSKDAIWTISSNGANTRRITTCRLPCLSDTEPAWSRTGSKLVFVHEQEHRLSSHHYLNSYGLDVIQLSTGDVRLLTPKLQTASARPAWRP